MRADLIPNNLKGFYPAEGGSSKCRAILVGGEAELALMPLLAAANKTSRHFHRLVRRDHLTCLFVSEAAFDQA